MRVSGFILVFLLPSGPPDIQTPSLPPLHTVAEIQMYLEEYRESVLTRATGSRNGSEMSVKMKDRFLSCFCHVQGANISEALPCTGAAILAFMLAFNLFLPIISHTTIIFCKHTSCP